MLRQMRFPWHLGRVRLNGALEQLEPPRGVGLRHAAGGMAMNPNFRNFALWVIIFLLVLALVTLFQSPGQKTPSSEITFSQLLSDADAGNVRDVTIAGPDFR